MIKGKLVDLRAPEAEDLPRFVAWQNDPEVRRNLGHRYPASPEEHDAVQRERMSRPLWFGDAHWSIDTKDGRHIGDVGLFETSPEDRSAQLGIKIGEADDRGRGYGGDAILTVLRFAFEEMNLNRVWLQVWGFNERGMRCYRRSGFVEEARLRDDMYEGGRYHDTVVMGILRDEYSTRAQVRQ